MPQKIPQIGSPLTISTLERRSVIDTVTSHDAELLSSVQGFDHSDLSFRCTSSNNTRQLTEVIDFFLRQSVELRSSHDGFLRVVVANDTNELSNGSSGFEMISSKHAGNDRSTMAVGYSFSGFRTRRVAMIRERKQVHKWTEREAFKAY